MEKTVIALGFFDGVHLGHQRIIGRAAALASAMDAVPCALTLENQPRAFLSGGPQCLLMSRQRREDNIKKYGAQRVFMLPFDRKTAAVSPEDFARSLAEDYNAAAVVCGDNYTFGDRGRGTSETLTELGRELGFECAVCPPVEMEGRTVSSSWIRELISQGDIKKAETLLGHEYILDGGIIHGRGIGRRLGFPTGNIALSDDVLLPKNGVYAAAINIDGQKYRCALNIGVRPTFELSEKTAEFYVIDFKGDLYGRDVSLIIKELIRPEMAFPSPESLSGQIARDVEKIRGVRI